MDVLLISELELLLTGGQKCGIWCFIQFITFSNISPLQIKYLLLLVLFIIFLVLFFRVSVYSFLDSPIFFIKILFVLPPQFHKFSNFTPPPPRFNKVSADWLGSLKESADM